MKLEREMMFEFNKDLKVGHMKYDWVSGSNHFANKWVPTQLSNDVGKQELQEVQSVINSISEDISHIDQYDAICENDDRDIINFFTQSDNFNFWVRLEPDYDIYYIHAYLKDGAK
ncbi:MAG: hypothetical protein ACOCQR_00935 [bacterium]